MQERRDERHGLIVDGRYRTGSGMAQDIVLRDLSRSGCQIHDRLGHLAEGQFLTIRIGPIGPIDSHVRWIRGRNAGVKFDRPLNDAVLEHIRSIARPLFASDDRQERQPLPEQPARQEPQAQRAPAPPPVPPATATASSEATAVIGGRTPLNLNNAERRFNQALGALATDPQGQEVLVGLSRPASDWLVKWRRELRSERAERETYHVDIYEAERLEELHGHARKAKQGY